MKNIYTYNKTSKIPKFKIGDLVRISLKRRDIFDKPSSNIKWSEELFKIHLPTYVTYVEFRQNLTGPSDSPTTPQRFISSLFSPAQ